MAEIRQNFGTANQSYGITLNGLGNTATRQGPGLDLRTAKPEGVHFSGTLVSGASGVSATGEVIVYAAGSADDGTTYGGDASGSDAAYTGEKNNLRPVASIWIDANNTAYEFFFDLSRAFPRTLPAFVVLIFENKSGASLAGSGNVVHYQFVSREVVA